jgi:hypothetical protein
LISVRSEVQVFPGPPSWPPMTGAQPSAFADLTFWLTSGNGAIAQLGERMLCKHEVVGSIPSGSTRRRPPSFGFLQALAVPWHRPKTRFRFRAHGSSFEHGNGLSAIVKRKYIRLLRRSFRRASASVSGRSMTATFSGVFEANWSFMIEPFGFPSRTERKPFAAERWASIMRAIKCLKGIRWMPWR